MVYDCSLGGEDIQPNFTYRGKSFRTDMDPDAIQEAAQNYQLEIQQIDHYLQAIFLTSFLFIKLILLI